MLNVALTGGIASGKSTVAQMLYEKGACLIDFDILARQSEEPDMPAWRAIVELFGSGILNKDRTINRRRLGNIVFENTDKLVMLNEIVHPIVFKKWGDIISELRIKQPEAIVVTDIPLLYETGAQKLFDIIVLVYASSGRQIERLMKRNGHSHEEALQRIKSQMPVEEKARMADIVLDNSNSMERTKQLVDDLWQRLVKDGGNKMQDCL